MPCSLAAIFIDVRSARNGDSTAAEATWGLAPPKSNIQIEQLVTGDWLLVAGTS